MARRSDHSRDQIKQMALDAATQIVAEEGLKGLSARKVAKAIGYTVGTLYLVFKNLDELILHLNASTLDALYERMESDSTGCKSGEPCVQALGLAYIRFAQENIHAWQLLFEHRLPEDEELPPWYDNKTVRLFKLVEKALLPMADHQKISTIRRAAHALWASVHGICSLTMNGKIMIEEENSAERLTEMMIHQFLKGLETP